MKVKIIKIHSDYRNYLKSLGKNNVFLWNVIKEDDDDGIDGTYLLDAPVYSHGYIIDRNCCIVIDEKLLDFRKELEKICEDI